MVLQVDLLHHSRRNSFSLWLNHQVNMTSLPSEFELTNSYRFSQFLLTISVCNMKAGKHFGTILSWLSIIKQFYVAESRVLL